MKQKLFFTFVLVCWLQQYCAAKDSTLVFKFSAGINYSLPDAPAEYSHPWYDHGGNGHSSLSNDANNGASAIIKAGIHKMFGKHAGIMLQLSYYHSKLTYTEFTTSTSYSNPTGGGTSTVINRINDVRVGRNTLSLSLGPVFYFHRFYVSPKLDVSGRLDQLKKDSTYTLYVYPTGTTEKDNTGKKAKADLIGNCGAGLMLGYDFKAGKNIIFIELQSDFYIPFDELPYPSSPNRNGHVSTVQGNPATDYGNLSEEQLKSRFRTALTIGFGF